LILYPIRGPLKTQSPIDVKYGKIVDLVAGLDHPCSHLLRMQDSPQLEGGGNAHPSVRRSDSGQPYLQGVVCRTFYDITGNYNDAILIGNEISFRNKPGGAKYLFLPYIKTGYSASSWDVWDSLLFKFVQPILPIIHFPELGKGFDIYAFIPQLIAPVK